MPQPQQSRAPGSFSSLPTGAPSQTPSIRPPPPRIDSHSSDVGEFPDLTINKTRQMSNPSPVPPIYAQFSTTQPNASTSSLPQNNFTRPDSFNIPRPDSQNFSRPAVSGARIAPHGTSSSPLVKHHIRKHSATPGLFEPTLPSTTTSNLSQIGASQSTLALSASQIAAQTAVMSHQSSQQHHVRQRSQTVPFPGEAERRGSASTSGGQRTVSPPTAPMLSLTEASAPRETGFGSHLGSQMDRLGSISHASAAAAAANLVFPRSPSSSAALPQQQVSPQTIPPPVPEKMSKSDKAKAKLFSRPSKISTKLEPKEKPLPSPGKIGSALSVLHRGNYSTTSLIDSGSQSLYSHNNSSTATIRPIEVAVDEKTKEKEKKHHFLSRQKNKLKDEYHLPLSSAASNSRPTDPNAPSSLYNFNVPPSPGPSSSAFGVKAKKDKKERSDSRLGEDSSTPGHGEWSTPSNHPSLSQQSTMYDPIDPGKLGLHNHMSLDDAWPYLKAKLLVIFEGEDLRLPIEDFNRVVQMHIQYCIHRRSPNSMLDDLRDFLAMGFSSLDRTLRKTSEDRFIPTLVELWLFTFTSILPYIQAVFLPLDLEVSGCGSLMNASQARDFWGGVVTYSSSDSPARIASAATVLEIRRLVLTAYRDIVILPRYDTLKTIFSRLSLEFLPSSYASFSSPTRDSASLSTSPPDSFPRPGTAMSLDPSVASYNSTSTTLLGDYGEVGSRSRAISNVSFGSDGFQTRPFTPSTNLGNASVSLGSLREQNVEDSKQVTDMVGRMLQCMSVLSSLGGVGQADDDGNRKMVELCKMLKLNWLGRGRTGRNRMGIVGGRVRRGEDVRVV